MTNPVTTSPAPAALLAPTTETPPRGQRAAIVLPEDVVRTVRPDTGAVLLNGIASPMQGLSRWDPLQGGFAYLQWTGNPNGVYHPGVDLNAGNGGNADCGFAAYAFTGGTVRAVLPWDGWTTGEGNHLWVELDDPACIVPAWQHVMHLQEFRVTAGQRVRAGDLLGLVGRTGNWDWCHAHLELKRARPSSWTFWPSGMSRDAVASLYYDPAWWFVESVAKGGAPLPEPIDELDAAFRTIMAWLPE